MKYLVSIAALVALTACGTVEGVIDEKIEYAAIPAAEACGASMAIRKVLKEKEDKALAAHGIGPRPALDCDNDGTPDF